MNGMLADKFFHFLFYLCRMTEVDREIMMQLMSVVQFIPGMLQLLFIACNQGHVCAQQCQLNSCCLSYSLRGSAHNCIFSVQIKVHRAISICGKDKKNRSFRTFIEAKLIE